MTSADKWKTQSPLISIWLVKDGRSGWFIRSIQRDSDTGGVKDGADAQGLKRGVSKHVIIAMQRDCEGLSVFSQNSFYSFFLQLFNHLIKVVLRLRVFEDAGQTYGRAGWNILDFRIVSFFIYPCGHRGVFWCRTVPLDSCWWLRSWPRWPSLSLEFRGLQKIQDRWLKPTTTRSRSCRLT